MLRLGRAAGARIGAALAALDMHPHEYGLLHALAEEDAASQSELAAALRVHPSNLVSLVDGLEAEGLVERTRDPADRRRSRVMLTQKGERVLIEADKLADAAAASLLSGLDADELAQFHALLLRGLGVADRTGSALAG
jgi:DNA-binding MarR family transcriptional regulator